jgi:hypothetical protein
MLVICRLAATCLLLATMFAGAAFAAPSDAPRRSLVAFASEAELADWLRRWAEEVRERREARRQAGAATPAPAGANALALADKAVAAEADAVTNLQHAGVDEGGIVKVVGDHMIILRRGRLYTVRVGDGALRAVARADAFGPGIDPRGAWYDEMLVAGNTVIVIGYSEARGGTEIGVFEVSGSGQIAYKATYHLRSHDYYSSRNYASRLIGSKLMLYSPLHLNPYAADPFHAFPALRKWRPGAQAEEFRHIAPATRVYRSDAPLDPAAGVALHSVTTCDLAQPELACFSTVVLGPAGRVFYVSPSAVYVWATHWRHGPAPAASPAPSSSLFRIPLDAAAPSALKVAGSPIDQFSFLEDARGHLNVLVRSGGRGDGMWSAENNRGELALLRVPLASFSDGRDAAPAASYRALPKADGQALHNRYVGEYLLYGAGAGWRRPQHTPEAEIYALRYAEAGGVYVVPLAHGVDRIETLGAHALAVGSDGANLHMTSLRLGRYPATAGHYLRRNAAQGETRSHGFFYRPQTERDGVLGLPIIGGGEAASGQLRRTSASLLYLRNRGLQLSELGTLDAKADAAEGSDGCKASCVDWYGNARPLFFRGRVFALLGDEIVEGELADSRIAETRRINFAARAGLAPSVE